MDEHHDHEALINGFYEEQEEIFEESDQAVYAFLDDDSRVCNQKFAEKLGYASSDEWMNVDVKGSFPDAFVESKSQKTLVTAYQRAMEQKVGSTVPVTWKKKSGGTVNSMVTLVPVAYDGHVLALHFIS